MKNILLIAILSFAAIFKVIITNACVEQQYREIFLNLSECMCEADEKIAEIVRQINDSIDNKELIFEEGNKKFWQARREQYLEERKKLGFREDEEPDFLYDGNKKLIGIGIIAYRGSKKELDDMIEKVEKQRKLCRQMVQDK